DRIDRQIEAELAAEDWRVAGERQDEIVAGNGAAIGQHLLDPLAARGETRDRRAEAEGDAETLAQFGEFDREDPAIAALVRRAIDAASDLAPRGLERRLDPHATRGIERLERQAMF